MKERKPEDVDVGEKERQRARQKLRQSQKHRRKSDTQLPPGSGRRTPHRK